VAHPLGVSHEASLPTNNDYAAHNTMMVYAYVIALAARKKDRISLLDWGGGIGHYYIISKVLMPEIEIDYHCKDLPLLCKGGQELLPEAKFHEKEEECFTRVYDLVLASSSLHYSEDWQRVVQRLASVTESYLYITRIPVVHRSASFVVVQRPYQYGYQTEYLCWFLNREEFLVQLDSLQMELVREFLIQERPQVHNAPEQGEYRGFLFRPRHLRRKG
jgi:putative methyltransferase (TIGR04325 family)